MSLDQARDNHRNAHPLAEKLTIEFGRGFTMSMEGEHRWFVRDNASAEQDLGE
jgi:hypothetical protein